MSYRIPGVQAPNEPRMKIVECHPQSRGPGRMDHLQGNSESQFKCKRARVSTKTRQVMSALVVRLATVAVIVGCLETNLQTITVFALLSLVVDCSSCCDRYSLTL